MQLPHDLFAALADPTRLRILLLVRHMELAMGELAEVLGQSQPRVSRHVRILAQADLVRRKKEGAWVFVGPGAHDATARIHDLLAALDPEGALVAVEQRRLDQVRAERQRMRDAWFEAHAEEWDLLRRLGGAEDEVEASVVQAAREPAIGRLLDIGTGTGRILELLAPEARLAIGIDRSPEMLRVARAKLASTAPSAEVRQADMRALPFEDGAFDTVTVHHVLHFTDAPEAALDEAARVLAPGGRLLVADYAPHAREDLRARHGHARLGFSEDTVIGWLAARGLCARMRARHDGPELSVLIWEGRR